MGKGENAGAFSPFPTMFSKSLSFRVVQGRIVWIILLSANAFNLNQSKNLSFGKELKQ